jgi:hypothetical protein
MNILITAGLAPEEVGGPAQYGVRLAEEFKRAGHHVRIKNYRLERILPIGIRHVYFFFKILPSILWADWIFALDTFSVGVPSVVASELFRKRSVVRIGGDFLWEAYVNRTKTPITLPAFNAHFPSLIIKERIVLSATRWLLHRADILVFNTHWQKRIWEKSYNLSLDKNHVIQNYMPEVQNGGGDSTKNFLWAGRATPVKNIEMLKVIENQIKKSHQDFELVCVTNKTHQQVLEYIASAHAVILPSISDVCPNFILEAASLGKPFILTKETGLDEVLPTGGIFVDPLSEKDLKDAVETMLDEKSYNRYKQEIEASYTPRNWNAVARDFLALICL